MLFSFVNNNSGNLNTNAEAYINSITVGRGGGNVASNTAVGFEALKKNTMSHVVPLIKSSFREDWANYLEAKKCMRIFMTLKHMKNMKHLVLSN